tara:strand:+ start:1358 stop:1729 length:372 start_codon:yes stop_codon:yes gene_type:complete
MNTSSTALKIGDIVKVQPMHYCYSFVSGGIENILTEDPQSPNCIMHHWTADGFRARILELVSLNRHFDGNIEEEEYAQIKIYGQGRKHFIKRNNEETKVVWIQERLISLCRDHEKKNKENKKK